MFERTNYRFLSRAHRRRGRVDVHHHLIPPAFVAAAERNGLTKVAGAALPAWTPERSLEVMDINGIETALLSLSAPGVHFGNRQEAISLARSCNEFAAVLTKRQPWRFGSFAVLPMPFTDAACREAEYELDVLGADGVVLLASTGRLVIPGARCCRAMRSSGPDLPLSDHATPRRAAFPAIADDPAC